MRDRRVQRCQLFERVQDRLRKDANWADQFDGHPDSPDYINSRRAAAESRAARRMLNGEAGQPQTVILKGDGQWQRYSPSSSDEIVYDRARWVPTPGGSPALATEGASAQAVLSTGKE